jgi:hypothetical protein
VTPELSGDYVTDFESAEFLSSLKTLSKDVSEVLIAAKVERNSAEELVDALKKILEIGGSSFQLNPEAFPTMSRGVKKMLLSPDGVIMVSYGDEYVEPRPLEELSGESLISIIDQIIHKAKRNFAERRKSEGERVSAFGEVAEGLKKIPNEVGQVRQTPKAGEKSRKNSLSSRPSVNDSH